MRLPRRVSGARLPSVLYRDYGADISIDLRVRYRTELEPCGHMYQYVC